MSIILGLLICVSVGIVALAVISYWAYYQHRINKQLHDETLRTRRLLSPFAFSIITVFVVLIVFTAVTAFMALTDFGAEKVPSEYRTAIYEYKAFSPSQMTGYRRHFSINENPGYTKTVEYQGDIRFIIFTREEAFNHFHPSFVIYAEYTGDKDILYYGVQGPFFAPDGRQMTGMGHAGAEFEGYICVIGTSNINSRFELSVGLFDSGLKGEDPFEYAAVRETITIEIPNPENNAIMVSAGISPP